MAPGIHRSPSRATQTSDVLRRSIDTNRITNVCCVGAGYVGGPSSTVLAYHCPNITVTVVDLDADRIAAWNSNSLPIFEPGLAELVDAVRDRNLFFSTDVARAIEEADLIYIAVNTPTKRHGRGAGSAADLTYLESAAKLIALHSFDHKIVVEKSTVPLSTAHYLSQLFKEVQHPSASFEVLSNPEFLAEGTAIRDLQEPDRVLIGHTMSDSGHAAAAALSQLYTNWIPKASILTLNSWSSELAKLAANALLAQRISSLNSLSAICEVSGADIKEISKAVGLDRRIGPKFLNASLGFGGSCFKKDVLNLAYIAESLHLQPVADYWRSVVEMNEWQKERFAHRVVSSLFTTLANKKVTVFGFAYKANTGDTRESAAIAICKYFIKEKALVTICDPQVSHTSCIMELEREGCTSDEIDSVSFERDPLVAAKSSSAIVICTEWNCFKDQNLDYRQIYAEMQRPAVIFDGRMIVDPVKLEKIGFTVEAIGRRRTLI